MVPDTFMLLEVLMIIIVYFKPFIGILGIEQNASQADIKKAYFKLAKKYHPDVNKAPDANAKFAEINKAYETLSDEKRKSMYDSNFNSYEQYQESPEQEGFNNYQDFDSFSSAFSGFGFDPFETIFGSSGFGRSAQTQQRNVQQRYDINVGKYNMNLVVDVKFKEAVEGAIKTIEYERTEICKLCRGAGGVGYGPCPHCKGAGMIGIRHGNMIFTETCSNCEGSGTILKDPCK